MKHAAILAALFLFALAAPQGARAWEPVIDARQIQELDRKANLGDPKIKVGDFYACDQIFIVAVSGNATGGDPAVIGPVIQKSSDKAKDGKRRHPRYTANGGGELIMGDVKYINPTSASSGRKVWIVVSHAPGVFTADGNPRLFIIQTDSEVEVNVTQGGKTGFILRKGSIKESKAFKVAADADKMMAFYAETALGWANTISNNVESRRRKHGDNLSALADEVIAFYASESAAYGALTGVAGLLWLGVDTLTDSDTMAQSMVNANMAYAMACTYKAKPKADDDFIDDLYILFSGDPQGILRDVAESVGKVDDFLDAVELGLKANGIKEVTPEMVMKAGKIVSKTKLVKALGRTAFGAKVLEKATPKVAMKIAKGYSKAAKVVPVLASVLVGVANYKEANDFGKEAKVYYANLAWQQELERIMPTVTKMTVSPGDVAVLPGTTKQFNATVTVTNNAAKTVKWAVYNAAAGTSIDANGKLTVGANQGSWLTVEATSTFDKTMSAQAKVTVPQPTVTKVAVVPAVISVGRGNTQKFMANVTVTNNADKSVRWSIAQGATNGTSIDQNGILTVNANQNPVTITVKATSTVDSTKSGEAKITVLTDDKKPTVTSVTVKAVNPAATTVYQGGKQQFAATVTGANKPPANVTWSVSGNINGTTIDSWSGMLTVGANQTPTTLTVKATSNFDKTKSGEAKITVSAAPPSGGGRLNSGWPPNSTLANFRLSGMPAPAGATNIMWYNVSADGSGVLAITCNGSAATDSAVKTWLVNNGWTLTQDASGIGGTDVNVMYKKTGGGYSFVYSRTGASCTMGGMKD